MDILLDTGATYASVDPRDEHWGPARRFLREPGLRLVTTSAVVSETYTLVRRRLGYGDAVGHVGMLRRSSFVRVYYVDEQFDADIWKKLETLRGIALSYVDAALIVLGERLRIRRIFTFDEDFREAGLEVVPQPE